MKSINIFSQRNKNLILTKKIEVSIYSGIRASIYKLFLKYDKDYDFIQHVMDEILIYQPNERMLNGNFVSDMNLGDFLILDYPSSTLDAIEIFYNLTKDNEFAKDVNNIFYNNNLPYELVDGTIKIISQIYVPNTNENNAKALKEDIDCNIVNKNYVLVLDRLHTYYGYFIQDICAKFGVKVPIDEHNHVILSKANKLVSEYLLNNSIITKFESDSITRVNSLLDLYNSIRNDKSYAHPNEIMDNDSAEFVVKIIAANMGLLESCVKRVR